MGEEARGWGPHVRRQLQARHHNAEVGGIRSRGMNAPEAAPGYRFRLPVPSLIRRARPAVRTLVAPSTRIKAKRLLLLKQQIEKDNDDERHAHQPQKNACHECVSSSKGCTWNHDHQDFVPGCTRFHQRREPSEATWRAIQQSQARKWKK